MRTLITLSLTIMFFLNISCTLTNQQKAERLVKQYLEKSLNDPGSYESVSFGTVTAFYDDYKDTTAQGKQWEKEASKLYHLAEKYHLLGDSLHEYGGFDDKRGDKYFSMGDDYFAKARKISEKIELKNSGKNGDLLSYTITHTYRAKNAFGALTLETRDFHIDDKFTEAY